MTIEHHARRVRRVDWVTAALVAVFVVLRLVATVGAPIAVFPDSPSYFDFALWGGVRFPVVTAFYSAIEDHRAVVTVQALLGAACWAAAAVVAGALIRSRGVRYAFQVSVLALGLTVPITRFDNALLSESVSISLVVLLSALAFRLACRPTRANAVATFVVAALWAMSRQNNAMLMLFAAAVVMTSGAPRAHRRLASLLAGGLVLLALGGLLLASSNTQIQEYNTAQILVSRILPDEGRSAWFEDRGMPAPSGGPIIGDSAVALQRDPTFGPWLEDDGPRTYLRFLLTHPGYVISTPFTDDAAFTGFLTGTTGYGDSRQVLPDAVETVFWPGTDTEQDVVVAVVVFGLTLVLAYAAVEASRRRAAGVGFGVLVVCLANIGLVTHAAGWEYPRLLVASSAAARIAVLWLFATALGGADVRRAEAPAEASAPRSLVSARRSPVAGAGPSPNGGSSGGDRASPEASEPA